MEECTFNQHFLNLFQDIDAVSMFSQLILEDVNTQSIFQQKSGVNKLVLMLDQFCDITLQSMHNFLEHKHRRLVPCTSEEGITCPEDIPCSLNKINGYLPCYIIQVQMRSELDEIKKEERIYFKRLFRFLKYLNEEIMFFSTHDNMYLLHTCIDK